MKRVYLSVPHLIGLVMATGLLWVAWGFSKIMSQQQPVDLVTTWLGGLETPRPWIVLPLVFAVVAALSRLQDLTRLHMKWPTSLRHSMLWPILAWLSASAALLINGLSGRAALGVFPLAILLVGFVCAGLILFKAKEIARRDDSSRPDGLAAERR